SRRWGIAVRFAEVSSLGSFTSFHAASKGKTVPHCPWPSLVLYLFRATTIIRARFPPCVRSMLINLLPDFFAVLNSTDRLSAYQRYFAAHRQVLGPYW